MIESDPEKRAAIANGALRSAGSVEAAKALLKLGATVKEAEKVAAEQSNGFWWYSCLCRKYELIRFFIDNGADRNGMIKTGSHRTEYPLSNLIQVTLSPHYSHVPINEKVENLLQFLSQDVDEEGYSWIESYEIFKTYITTDQRFKVNEAKLQALYKKAVELKLFPVKSDS